MNEVTLNNGIKMPQLGLGVWKIEDEAQAINTIHHAVNAGYRLIDTAMVYLNEADTSRPERIKNLIETTLLPFGVPAK